MQVSVVTTAVRSVLLYMLRRRPGLGIGRGKTDGCSEAKALQKREVKEKRVVLFMESILIMCQYC